MYSERVMQMYINNIIPVTKPYIPPLEKYQELVAEIFKRGWLTNNGPMVRSLETGLQDYLGVKHVICVANGTLALQVLYKALELDGRVITTPFSFVATSSSLKWQGLEPIFADINPDTFNLCHNKVEDLIDDKVSAILPVHVFGSPVDVEKFDDLGNRFRIPIIYDASHAFGVKKHDGTSVLNYGKASTLSFHSTKLFHSIEGGAVVTNDDYLAERIRLMINFGIDGPDSVFNLGINAKMNEFEAAMGLLVLDVVDELIEERLEIDKEYIEKIDGRLGTQLRDNCWQLNGAYMPILPEDEHETREFQNLLEKNSILTRRYFSPSLDRLDFLSTRKNVCENSRRLASKILCLPIYNGLKKSQIKNIVSLIRGP